MIVLTFKAFILVTAVCFIYSIILYLVKLIYNIVCLYIYFENDNLYNIQNVNNISSVNL